MSFYLQKVGRLETNLLRGGGSNQTQHGIHGVEAAVHLLGSGTAASAAALEEGAVVALGRQDGIARHVGRVGEDVADGFPVDVTQHIGRMVAEADIAQIVDCDGPAAEIRAAGGELHVRIRGGVHEAQRGADAAHEAHGRMGCCKGFHVRKSLPEGGRVHHQLLRVLQAHAAYVKAVHHDAADPHVVKELERSGDVRRIDPGEDEHREGARGQALRHPREGIHGLLPGALEAREVLVDFRPVTQHGNLDGAHTQVEEVLQRIRSEQRSVGKHIHTRSPETRREGKVVDIAEEHGLPAGEGDGAYGSLGEEFAERFPGPERVRCGKGRTAVPPVIITEPATLVAGLGKFKDDIVYADRSHQRMVMVGK